MSKPTCLTCGKEFASKASLKKHGERKVPCKASSTSVCVKEDEVSVTHEEQTSKESSFRETSIKFNSTIPKEKRKEEGIYFTPKKARDLLFETLKEIGVKPKKILEPSFGSGEFLLDAKTIYPKAKLFGVEKNKELFDSVKHPDAVLSNSDFLTWSSTERFDLIIGNPPYFVFIGKEKEQKKLLKKYSGCLEGRPNIYILFLYKCLEEHLEKDGYLAFIIPTSLYNSSYYQPMRNYIQEKTTIKYLETLDKPGFYETGQETMLIILQKKKINDDYIFKAKNNLYYISPYYKELYELTKDSTTIKELGLGVKTGSIVWNQVKGKLTNDPGTLLIYSSNIKDSKLELNNLKGDEKKQYVKEITKPSLTGPVILVERGYGNSYSFSSVFVDLKDFYAENHINVIYPLEKNENSVKHLEKVLKSFKDERTCNFVKYFIANGSVSSTDLESIVPIYI